MNFWGATLGISKIILINADGESDNQEANVEAIVHDLRKNYADIINLVNLASDSNDNGSLEVKSIVQWI